MNHFFCRILRIVNRVSKPLLLSLIFIFASGVQQGANAETKLRGCMVSRAILTTDVKVLDGWGANGARYPLEWLAGASTATPEEYQTWLDGALNTFDSALPSFRSGGMKVVLNLYSPPGGFSLDKTCLSSHTIFCKQWAQEAFIESWQKITTRYLGDSSIYGFDLANEPGFRTSAAGLLNWSDLAAAAANAIRAIDPTRHIIIEPPFGDFFRFSQLKPLALANISYSPHVYYPLEFQYQGLGGRKINVKYPTSKLNKAALVKRLKRIKDFAKQNKTARIYIGEFSAVRWAPGKSAYNYLKDMISIFEKEGWDWTYHAFRESDAWSLEHDGNIKNKRPVKKQTDRLTLIKSFFKKNRQLN